MFPVEAYTPCDVYGACEGKRRLPSRALKLPTNTGNPAPWVLARPGPHLALPYRGTRTMPLAQKQQSLYM